MLALTLWPQEEPTAVVVVAAKLEHESDARIEGVLMHELGHAAYGGSRHTERDADKMAEHIFERTIFYDHGDVQNTRYGTTPRPDWLPA